MLFQSHVLLNFPSVFLSSSQIFFVDCPVVYSKCFCLVSHFILSSKVTQGRHHRTVLFTGCALINITLKTTTLQLQAHKAFNPVLTIRRFADLTIEGKSRSSSIIHSMEYQYNRNISTLLRQDAQSYLQGSLVVTQILRLSPHLR